MSDTCLPTLSPAEARQVDQACDRLEAAWKAGQRPRPEDYLGAADRPVRPALLRQLLLLDWDYRRGAGDEPRPEEYLERFPGDRDLVEQVSREMNQTTGGTWPGRAAAPDTPWFGGPAADLMGEAGAATDAGSARYELLREVGRGGIGVVFRGRDRHLGRELAVKLLREEYRDRPDVRRRFVEEARVGSRLQHPAIVPVYELGGLGDRRPYFTMKLVEGQTLAELLRQRPDPGRDLPRLLGIFGQVCQAMAYAHARGVVHRDLKPANVMVGAFGEVQVMDWGFAKVLAGVEEAAEGSLPRDSAAGAVQRQEALSQSGALLGTPAYMPPEQARGEAALIDPRADVFALGAILCEILTGWPPYAGNSADEICRRAAAGDLADAHARLDACGADPDLVRLAERCLAPQKADRPAEAGNVAAAVAAYLSGIEERLHQERLRREREQVQQTEERRRRKLWLGLAAAVLAAVALAAGGGLYWQGQRAQRHLEAAQALETAEGQLRAGQFAVARESLTRAQDRLGDDGPTDLVRRQGELQAAWQLVRDLEQIQFERTNPKGDLPFDNPTAQKRYQETLARAGYDVTGGDVADVAERIRRCPVSGPILEAIDNWALVCAEDMRLFPARAKEYRQRRDRLLEVAGAVDPDPPLRDKIRSPRIWDDRRQLEELAELAPRTDLSPRLAALLARLLGWAGGDPEPLLRTFQRRHPNDFWLNFELGNRLGPVKPAEALRFLQAALAIKPHQVLVVNVMAHTLGASYQWEESAAVVQQALVVAPESAMLHTMLAQIQFEQGDIAGSQAQLRESLRLEPDLAATHCVLGGNLQQSGRFREGLDCLRQAQKLTVKNSSYFRPQIAQWLREGERLVELDRRLSNGIPDIAPAADWLGFGDVCFYQNRYAEAVEFYRRALAQDPKLAEGRHYQAASAAALAAAGRGESTQELDAGRREQLRKQALSWLRDDLEFWGRRPKDPKSRSTIHFTLWKWRRHANLSGVREKDALAQLPADEQAAWQRFWSDVEALLGKVREGN